jgi:cytochrome c2
LEKHCVHCHQEIWTNKFKAPPDKITKWKKTVGVYLNAPNLEAAGARFSADWIASFLQKPHDMRPNMISTMPRLGVTDQQAADIGAYLTKDAKPAPEVAAGDAAAGRKVLENKACGTCHLFTGVADLPVKPSFENADDKARAAIEVAPDLRGTRDRSTAAQLVRWLVNPPAVKPSTLMPSFNLTEQEARDAAAYILTTALAPAPKPEPLKRLPPLETKVTFEDVDREVLHKTCRHCHTNPDTARGDGGPGMTGGFGFAPRRLDFSSYEGVLKGLLDPKGERMSVFAPLKDGTPRLVAALLARHKEESGEIDADVRGMPLGLPGLTAEQIQIVESWIKQGRPQ